tara:strand:+ start:1097 stop:1549 length:453 start_codon:yes stop_codon:yes gene_type:complete
MSSTMDYWSDASYTSDSEEEDVEPEELYDPRDVDYWAIEHYLDTRGPPSVIEYAKNIGTVALRECVVGNIRKDIESVVNFVETFSWSSFWEGPSNYKTDDHYFSHDDWDAIGEYCFSLCECCDIVVDMDRVRSCMIRILEYGKFKKQYYS